MAEFHDAPWERTGTGSQTEWSYAPSILGKDNPRYRIFLKSLVLQKMKTLYLISAEFNEIRYVFEPWVCVIIDEGSMMKFLGVYIPAYPVDDPNDRPTLCLRKGEWNLDLYYEQFYRTENKEAYVEKEQSGFFDIVYSSFDAQADIVDASNDIVSLFRQGFKLEPAERPKIHWRNIWCEIWDSGITYSISFSPFSRKNEQFEKWINRWINVFDSVNFNNGFTPKGKTRVSYRESLMDWINYFHRI